MKTGVGMAGELFSWEGGAPQKGPVLQEHLPITGKGPSLGMTAWYQGAEL